MCFPPQRRAIFQHRNFRKCSETGVFCTFWLRNVLRATTVCTFSTSELPKVLQTWCVLYVLTSKCASRHNGVHFFDIGTSKSAPAFCTFWLQNVLRATTACTFSISQLPKVLRPFVHFDFEMCFAPQRRALFRHRNFQRCSEPGVFCAFWLRNVLRATTACTFSTSQLPKVLRTWCALYILSSKCASRHNGVHFFDISTSKSGPTLRRFVHFDSEICFAPQRCAIFHRSSGQMWLRTRRFSETTFRFSGATNHWKNTVFRDFPTFLRTCIFFLLTLSLLWSSLFCSSLFYSSLFYSSLLSASSQLCFSSIHIVGSLTSKLPSINMI